MIDRAYDSLHGKNIIVEIPNEKTGMVDIWEVSPKRFEKAVRVGLATLIAQKQPRPTRRYEPLVKFLKKHRGTDAAALWKKLHRYDDDFPLKIQGGEITFSRNKLEIHTPEGKRVFTYKKFREYFRAIKNPPNRTK